MKKILLAFFILIGINGKAQITLEQVYNNPNGKQFYYTDLGNNNYKYFTVDLNNDYFSLYNLDYTPYMLNIPTAVSLDSGMFTIGYVTNSLFDCDSTNIEYAITTYGTSSIVKPFYVFRTDGTLLFQKDSVVTSWCFGCYGGITVQPIFNTPEGAKLILVNLTTDDWFIYGLCGELPTTTFDFSNQSMQFVQVYPNPSSQTLTFEIHPPSNMEEYELVIVDNAAREIKREKINALSNRYTIDVRPLSSGSYIYSLCSKTKAYQTGKFVINK